ncbi:PDZ domain-containing protein [Thalassoglobus sp.]|uniref:PDZ domain-containing protein n=1 Tax=Thalassoglobus sp. TaxID=2795869 RepID=UPI003AA7EB7E
MQGPRPRPIPPHVPENPDHGHHDGGHGHGGHGHGHHIPHFVPDWCFERPHFHDCYWWFDICTPIRDCRPIDIVYCDWDYVRCDVVVGGTIVRDARWYLGMQGMFLPGKGLGIESVEPGSPAELVGLAPGMVILEANGIPMVEEEAMSAAIAESQGVLNLVLMMEGDDVQYEATVEMTRLVVAGL